MKNCSKVTLCFTIISLVIIGNHIYLFLPIYKNSGIRFTFFSFQLVTYSRVKLWNIFSNSYLNVMKIRNLILGNLYSTFHNKKIVSTVIYLWQILRTVSLTILNILSYFSAFSISVIKAIITGLNQVWFEETMYTV